MENLKTQLDNYVSMDDRQKEMTKQLENILPEQVPGAEAEGEFLADTIRDTFPPELLYHLLCVAKDETSVDIMCGRFYCNFLRKSRL
jgi:hypothetical protein